MSILKAALRRTGGRLCAVCDTIITRSYGNITCDKHTGHQMRVDRCEPDGHMFGERIYITLMNDGVPVPDVSPICIEIPVPPHISVFPVHPDEMDVMRELIEGEE